jgi:hypothetical protein
MSQEHTHAVYVCYSAGHAVVVSLPFDESELPPGYELHDSYPSEPEAEKERMELTQCLNIESIHH